MKTKRIVLGFSVVLVVVILAAGLNNWLFDQRVMERLVIEEDMILETEGKTYFVLPDQPQLELEIPATLLEEVIYGNPSAVSYSYNKLTKKGHVVRMKVT